MLAVLPFVAFAGDRLQAAIGEFRFARQRLRFRAHLCGEPSVAVDLGAHVGEPGFGLEARRQFVQRRVGTLMGALHLEAVGGNSAVRLGERRSPRRVAVDLAFGRGMAFAGGVGLALGGAPGVACRGLGRGRGLQRGLGALQRLPLGAGVDAGLLQLVLYVDEARALGEPPRRAGRRVRSRDESVPAPDVAFERHQPLAGLELRHQLRAAVARDDADLRQPARQLDRGIDMGRQRVHAFRQRGVAFADAGIGPAHRRGRVDRGIEIVAQRSTERLLKTLGDGDAIDDRRPQILGLAVDEF